MPLRPLNDKEKEELHVATALRRGFRPTYNPTHEYFRHEQITGKGYGCRTNQGITYGTLILVEAPLFIVENVEAGQISKPTINRINNAVLQLNEAQRQQFRELVQPFGRRSAQPDKERFLANNFQMTPDQNGRHTQGIFLRASRFNHSCIPNAWYNWNPYYTDARRNPRGSLTVHAIRNIRADEEILVNYRSDDAYWPTLSAPNKTQERLQLRL